MLSPVWPLSPRSTESGLNIRLSLTREAAGSRPSLQPIFLPWSFRIKGLEASDPESFSRVSVAALVSSGGTRTTEKTLAHRDSVGSVGPSERYLVVTDMNDASQVALRQFVAIRRRLKQLRPDYQKAVDALCQLRIHLVRNQHDVRQY